MLVVTVISNYADNTLGVEEVVHILPLGCKRIAKLT